MSNFRSLRALLGLVAALALPAVSVAQEPPLPPLIKLVVPFAAGAGTDIAGRALAAQLGPRLGVNIIVDNRPGASGIIGTELVARGPRDGSQLLFASVSIVTTAAARQSMPFDITSALAPVALTGQGPMVVAVPSGSPIKTPADLLAAARAKPDELTHGTGGIGTIAHMAAELLNDAAKVKTRHIPYKGAAPAVVDLAAGRLDYIIAAYSTLAPQVTAGRVRLIAVTSAQPSPRFPDLPTMASVVPGFSADLWQAVWAPAGTPPTFVERLNREINETMKTPAMVEILQQDAFVAVPMKPQEAAVRVKDAYATWKKLAAAKNIEVE